MTPEVSSPADTPDTSNSARSPSLVPVIRGRTLFNSVFNYLPFKAQLSLLHQRIVLTLRWAFRLPIDQLKEERIEARFDALLELANQQSQTISKLVETSNNMQRRLQHYEQNIPRMRELKQQLNKEDIGIRKASNGSKLIGLS
jgi:hypothetical protein